MNTKTKETIMDDEAPIVHHGHNIRAYRRMRLMKQEALAKALGKDWTQKKISQLEAKEKIDNDLLAQVAKALDVSVEEIENFTEEKVVYNIQHNYEGSNVGTNSAAFNNHHCTFNPLDEYKKMVDKNEELYKQLLQSEKEKIMLMEKMLNEKK